MVILTAQADMTLAGTVGPVLRQAAGAGGGLRGALTLLKDVGLRGVQLDITVAGLRPRELSKRDRQDLLATLRRADMTLAGVDFFIPVNDYQDAAQVDRAAAATVAAIELAADLGRVPVSLALPVAALDAGVASAIATAAEGHAVPLAVHGENQLAALEQWLAAIDQPGVGAGVDPAGLLAAGLKPEEAVYKLGRRVKVARLSDLVNPGSLRCAVGAGELDVLPYRLALQLAAGRVGPVVLDLRGVEDVVGAARKAVREWERASPG